MNDELTFFTVKAAAKVLQCSERTIRRHIEDGLLGICSKKGKTLLIPKQSLTDFLTYRALERFANNKEVPHSDKRQV